MIRPRASAVTMWAAILVTAAVLLALFVSFARLSAENQDLRAADASSQSQRQSLATQANALAAQVRTLGERPVVNVQPVEPYPGPQGEPGLSIIGPMGPAGIGIDGRDGRDGKRGKTGAQGASTTGATGATGESITGAQGEPGVDGKDGAAGEPGRNGKDGISVTTITCEGAPQTFTFHFSNGTEQTVTCEPAPPPDPVEEPTP